MVVITGNTRSTSIKLAKRSLMAERISVDSQTNDKAIGRSLVNYAATIWTPQLYDNHPYCCAKNHHRLSPHVKSLAPPSKNPPVKQHDNLLSRQYLLSCQLSNNPSSAIFQYLLGISRKGLSGLFQKSSI